MNTRNALLTARLSQQDQVPDPQGATSKTGAWKPGRLLACRVASLSTASFLSFSRCPQAAAPDEQPPGDFSDFAHSRKVFPGPANRNHPREKELHAFREHARRRMPPYPAMGSCHCGIENYSSSGPHTPVISALNSCTTCPDEISVVLTPPERKRRRLIHPLSVTRRWKASIAHGNGKCPQDLKREVVAAWRRFLFL